MSDSRETAVSVADPAATSAGVLPYQAVRALVRDGEIVADEPVADIQVQPASLDLRLDEFAWRVRASFLPGAKRTVSERLDDLGLHRIDLSRSAVLEKGCVYIVQLQERLALGERIGGFANPKSSTGRIDLFTRLIADHAVDFDAVPPGYAGPLYAEIFPRAFSVVVRNGSRLNQLRFVRGTPGITAAALRHMLDDQPLVDRRLSETEMRTLSRGVPLSVDLAGIGGPALVGFPRPTTPPPLPASTSARRRNGVPRVTRRHVSTRPGSGARPSPASRSSTTATLVSGASWSTRADGSVVTSSLEAAFSSSSLTSPVGSTCLR